MACLMYFLLTTGRNMATESSQRFPENGNLKKCRHHLDVPNQKLKWQKDFQKSSQGQPGPGAGDAGSTEHTNTRCEL